MTPASEAHFRGAHASSRANASPARTDGVLAIANLSCAWLHRLRTKSNENLFSARRRKSEPNWTCSQEPANREKNAFRVTELSPWRNCSGWNEEKNQKN